jgi:hypothetical protein
MRDLELAIATCYWKPTVVLSGGARGADYLGELWAKENGVPLEIYPAHWAMHGKAAGPIRNREMARHAEALIALWDGKSRGTKDMIDVAEAACLRIYVRRLAARRGNAER